MLAIAMLLFVLLYIVVFYIDNFKNSKSRAPGPYRFPPLGNLVQIVLASKYTHVALDKLAETYGDVMSIKMGFFEAGNPHFEVNEVKTLVILSSSQAIREIFPKDEASGRECSGILWDRNLKQNIGLVCSNESAHSEMRKFCRDTLRHYGFGSRESMQLLLLDELTEFVAIMETTARSNSNRIIHFDPYYFTTSLLNLMCKLVFGKRYDYNDPEFQKIIEGTNSFMKNGCVGSGVMVAYPFLRHVFPETLGYNAQMTGVRMMSEVAMKHLSERRNLPYKDQPECFADHFLQKMDADANKTSSLYTGDSFSVVFADIIMGGADTTSNTVNFVILLLATHPTIQEKLYEEILEVIGPYRQPHLENKSEMIYTQAVMLEAIRWNRVGVFGGPRKALDDFTYREKYLIKKGTVLMFNLQSIFFNEEIWGDPHVFRPERFLDNGKLNDKKSNIIQLAFGAGSKRNCFGEVLARDSLFLYTTTLIQKFKFTLPQGHQPDLEPGIGLALFAKPYDTIVTVRNESYD